MSVILGVQGLRNENTGSLCDIKQDALEAVKLDPAVLEAQVMVHSKHKAIEAVTLNRRSEIERIENKNERVLSPPAPAPTPSRSPQGFKDTVLQIEATLLSLTPHQLELLMKYTDVLRRQRTITQRYLECAFCKNNGKPSSWYTSHALRDVRGRVRCPILRGFHCRRCGATGDQAHTIKYCPDLLTDLQSSCTGKFCKYF